MDSQGTSKKLLLIGATASIGSALVLKAQHRGYQVTGTFRNELKKYSEITEWLELDLSKSASIENFSQNIDGRQFDLIIFLVGATNPERNNLQEYVLTHFMNSIKLFEILIKEFAQKSPCYFVFISSRAAIYPSYDTYYSAIKSGLTSALRSLSKYAHPQSKFLSILPGLIEGSEMYWQMPLDVRESHKLRSSNSLQSIEEATENIFDVIDRKSQYASGDMIEIGPSYS
jgi:short-subunit dehydrogenase